VDGETQPQSETYRSKRGRVLKGKTLERFNQFWRAFDYRKDKAAAADVWIDMKVDDETFTQILQAAEAEAKARPALISKGRTPKYPQGWLTARRWEDEDSDADATADDGEDFNAAVRRLCPGRALTPAEEASYFEPPPDGAEGGTE